MTYKELIKEAKELKIVGRWDMRKDELIKAIEAKKKEASKVEEKAEEIKLTPIRKKEDRSSKSAYIENVEPGVMVAFKFANKAKSAKLIARNSEERKLKLVTSYGKEYIVSYDDVLWIKTGPRWPKGVYRLLKGLEANEE
jgi:hypothetical protein|nr:MAG TPA: Rho termination factor, N-terminal domain [Caudoviricetes sp.]